MTTPKPEDLQILFADEVQQRLDGDPEMAEAMREFCAALRQALQSVHDGQHPTIDDALEAILGARPVKLDPETGEPIPGASLHADLTRADFAGMQATDIGKRDED